MAIDLRLKARLELVAARQARLRLWCRLATCWAGAAFLGLVLVALGWDTGWATRLALGALALLGGVTASVFSRRQVRRGPDWRDLARRIERHQPELDGRLVTAVQQQPKDGGQLNYLQERLLEETLRCGLRSDWAEIVPPSRLALARMSHWLGLLLLGIVLWELRPTDGASHGLFARSPGSGITVTPGDTTLERGNSLVVLARFAGALPATVDLVVEQPPGVSGSAGVPAGVTGSPGTRRRIPLVKSLADPMFGGSVPEVASNLVYHVEYAAQRTRDFKVSVFEHPRLERADADLTFPDYTGQRPQRIENTRRLSAVEGSRLDLTLQLNKPVASARLVAKDKERSAIPLLVDAARPVAALKEFPLETSRTYELQLVDAEGRTNKVPAQFVFEVSKNRPPEIRLASPRGDLRPSPLEEIAFDGTVWDDFGVQAYGVGYTLAGQEPKFIELGHAVPAREKRPFHYLLRLEDLAVQPDQLIAWFVWADDTGPDGQVRRSTGDLYFGEVRPFEEVFREGQGTDAQSQAGGDQSGQSSPTDRLTELEKKIIIATWKLQRGHNPTNAPPSKPPGQTRYSPRAPTPGAPASPPASFTPLGAPASSPASFNGDDLATEGAPAPGALRFMARMHALPVAAQLAGQDDASDPPGAPASPPASFKRNRLADEDAGAPSDHPAGDDDATVVRDSQAQALDQAEAAARRQRDPRAAALWSAAIREMEKALARLDAATDSPAALAEALAAEQAAYQALLRLQQHEYEVMRSRNRNARGSSSREQQMQRQLEQMDLTQSENRYETQRQAQRPQNPERREQLQVMSRLQELARRQQDLNDRFKELQTALQEARTEQEREEIRRRLKRLQEEEQQMLADVDELRQRMDRPENQSRLADERRQLDQTRDDVQRAADAASQGAASQALAAGTRAQRQLQQLREQMRKENSSQFSDDLRELRAQARDLAQRQEELSQALENSNERKSLSDSPERQAALDQLAGQAQRLTNLVERATQVSQHAEEAEPLLSRQLYDTVRQFSQDSAKNMQEVQEELLNRGLLTRSLLERLKQNSEPDGAKLLDITSELLRLNFLPTAAETGQRARTGIDQLKRGVERAAESVLGDDTEALRLAQRELDQLTDELQREIARAEGAGSGTNQTGSQAAATAPSQARNESRSRQDGRAQGPDAEQARNPNTPATAQNQEGAEQANSRENSSRPGTEAPSTDQQTASTAQGRQPGDRTQQGDREQPGQAGANPRDAGRDQARTAEGDRRGGSLNDPLRRELDRVFNENGAYGGYGGWWNGPITGEDYLPWSDRLRDVEEMLDQPDWRNIVVTARDRARVLRQQVKHEHKKPDWAVVRLQVMKPLVELRDRIAEELARRDSREALVPIDRDPVPNRYSDLVRRYYEELGKEK